MIPAEVIAAIISASIETHERTKNDIEDKKRDQKLFMELLETRLEKVSEYCEFLGEDDGRDRD